MSLSESDKKDKREIRRLRFLNALMALTLIMGVAGGLWAGESFFDSLFNTLLMFALNNSIPPANILLNVTRFLAAFFTLSAILAVVENLFLILGDRIRGKRKDSMFVFGSKRDSEELRKTQKQVIDGSNGFVDASNYVLLGSEEENMQFYLEHYDRLADKHVYFKTETLPGVLVGTEHFQSFCPEELAAEQFWVRYPMTDFIRWDEGPADLTVVVIGFEKLGEELLFYGLQACAFANVTWHIFGDTHRFSQTHFNLDKLNVVTYTEPWYDHIDVLRRADRIIVAEQQQQLKVISDLFLISADWRLYVCTVFSREENGAGLLLRHRSGTIAAENLILFDWKSEAGLLSQTRRAQVNETNSRSDAFIALMRNDWEKADTFKRYSYLYLLNFREQIKVLKERWGDRITTDELARIVHRRMCNYYWYHNWSYAENPDPDDPEAVEYLPKRLHRYLRPLEDEDTEQKARERHIVEALLASEHPAGAEEERHAV